VSELLDTFRLGKNTRERLVSRDECPAFDRHGIAIVGISEARPPYRIVRPRLYHQEVQVCIAGYGLMRIGNRWAKLTPGKACLSPLGALQAFHAVRGVPWRFAWVHYQAGASFLTDADRAEMVVADPAPLSCAISALHHEVMKRAEPAILTLLTEWLHLEALRVARRTVPDERLQRTFLAVDARPGHPWTLSELARLAGMSREQLRRVCRVEFRQSPLERVRALRMVRAAVMLSEEPAKKVETIALEIGYSSLHAFSTAFKETYGKAPTHYR
jgi:AraC-like DNA-binding protein